VKIKKNNIILIFLTIQLIFIGTPYTYASIREQEDQSARYKKIVAAETTHFPCFKTKDLIRILKKVGTGKHTAPQRLLEYLVQAKKRGVPFKTIKDLSRFILHVQAKKMSSAEKKRP
jgi:hypothetical protein